MTHYAGSVTAAEQFADEAAERLGDERRAVPADELRAVATAISDLADHVFSHAKDTDDPAALARLLLDLRDAKQALAEAWQETEWAYMECADNKTMELDGVGVVEIRRKKKRTAWRNEDLWHDLVLRCQQEGTDPLDTLASCVRPSWRVTALRELDLEPGDYCIEEDDGYSLVLPPRDLDERGF